MDQSIEPVSSATPGTTLAYGQIPLRGADLPLLISLDVLLDECNVTRAAARLHVSQPALSAQLARLRRLFDDPLLISTGSGRGFVPSQFAMNLHRRLKPALASLTSAIQVNTESFRPDRDARSFTIAATNTSAAIILPTLISKAQSYLNRELRFATVEPDFTRVAAQLEKGEIDMCLSPACMLPPGLVVTDLVTMPHVMVHRRGHPNGTGPVELKEYCEQLEHINVARDSALHGYIDEQLYRQGHARDVRVAVKDAAFVPAMLKRSDLVCTLPEHLANPFDTGLEYRPLAFPLANYALCMAWHPRCEDDPSFLWLRGELNEVAEMLS